jgi:uncharacterized repeat protein (TIGR03837 family)
MKEIHTCDIFCSVVDNYGDIGIASRLARQLLDEQGLQVRLWVDDLQVFNQLHNDISIQLESQDWRGVEVRRWTASLPQVIPCDLVIEAFACELPESFLRAMVARPVKPVWINLEYLSAESWVVGCHGLPSPHPRSPLSKYFFFPGYSHATGGLLREGSLLARIQTFQRDPGSQSAFWKGLAVPVPKQGETKVSLFAYENHAIPSLLGSFARHQGAVTCFLPIGKALVPALDFLGKDSAEAGECFREGNLTLRILPFLSQGDYDRLLWACDVNIVRGEDSFIRAQFAGRPVLWQAYVQEDDAHEKKVEAWLDLYLEGIDPCLAEDMRKLFSAWNRQKAVPRNVLEIITGCSRHARAWASHLAGLPSLSETLVKFAISKV